MPVGSLGGDGHDDDEPVERGRFGAIGFWSKPPEPWHDGTPESLLERRQVYAAVCDAVDDLPETQRVAGLDTLVMVGFLAKALIASA